MKHSPFVTQAPLWNGTNSTTLIQGDSPKREYGELVMAVVAALLGGLVGGIAVVIGVYCAEGLRQANDRENAMKVMVVNLVMKLPYVLTGMTATGVSMDTSLDSHWWRQQDEIFELLMTLDYTLRPPLEHLGEIKALARDIFARVEAASSDFLFKDRRLSFKENVDINVVVGELKSTVFGDTQELLALVGSYRKAP
jgi:hypothetical protein